jgi:ferredoxin-type protein NapF
MGSAEVIYSDCLLAKNRECDRCKAACSYDAITIEPSATTVLMKPVVAPEKCVGCGACAVICPARTITMKPPIQV